MRRQRQVQKMRRQRQVQKCEDKDKCKKCKDKDKCKKNAKTTLHWIFLHIGCKLPFNQLKNCCKIFVVYQIMMQASGRQKMIPHDQNQCQKQAKPPPQCPFATTDYWCELMAEARIRYYKYPVLLKSTQYWWVQPTDEKGGLKSKQHQTQVRFPPLQSPQNYRAPWQLPSDLESKSALVSLTTSVHQLETQEAYSWKLVIVIPTLFCKNDISTSIVKPRSPTRAEK